MRWIGRSPAGTMCQWVAPHRSSRKMTQKPSSAEDCGGYETFERAATLLEGGELDEAEGLLTQLAATEDYGDEASALLGIIFVRGGRAEEAIACFKDLASKQPGSESASLGLFHALWKAGKADEALAEMRRYRAEHESMEYRRLLRDLKAEGVVPP